MVFHKTIKGYFGHGRPLALLDHVNISSGNGFSSGHATIAARVTILYYQVPKQYRKYTLLIVIFVGISRMYIRDVSGVWALGTFIASVYMIIVNPAHHHTTE